MVTMTDICRLCLSFGTENMWPLSHCDGIVYNNISFTMHIPLNNALPSQVCTTCITKLSDFKHFYLEVKNNEKKLHEELNKSEVALNNLYAQIKNGIKNETDENKYERNIEKNIIENNKNGTIFENIKHEEDVSDNDVNFDLEDELPLFDLKHAKAEEIEETNDSSKTDEDTNSVDTNTHNSNFKCLTCFEEFITRNMLLNHYNDVHKGKEMIEKNTYTLVSDTDKMYKCNNCDKSYDNIRGVNKHAKIHSAENFHCKVCGRTYKTVSQIMRHGRAHNGTKISCSFGCGYTTVYSGALKSHEGRHREEFKYKCETCGKIFQVKTWYEQHQNVHTGAKPYVCDICGMAFHMDKYLKVHCRNKHPEAVTRSRSRYVCVHCSKPCGHMNALTLHLKEHGIVPSFLCDLCGKTVSSKYQLIAHRRTHTGLKPYSCSTCDKSFSKRWHVKQHQLTHSGERAHECGACGKRYGQRGTLLRHQRKVHSGNTNKCHKCDTKVKSPAELTAHQKLCSS